MGRRTSSIKRERPKFSNLNCGEMVCNGVKYCPEKDADSYYGRADSLLIRSLSSPSPLRPLGGGIPTFTCGKMLTRRFPCQSVTLARENPPACLFSSPPPRFLRVATQSRRDFLSSWRVASLTLESRGKTARQRDVCRQSAEIKCRFALRAAALSIFLLINRNSNHSDARRREESDKIHARCEWSHQAGSLPIKRRRLVSESRLYFNLKQWSGVPALRFLRGRWSSLFVRLS